MKPLYIEAPIKWRCVVLALMNFCFVSERCNAQGLLVEAGWKHGTDTSSLELYSGQLSEVGLPWSVSIYIGRFLATDKPSRFGFKYAWQAVDIIPRNPELENIARRDGTRFMTASLLAVYQRMIYRWESLSFFAEVSTGISGFDSEVKSGFNHCDSICLPNLAWQLSPGIGAMLQVYSAVGVQATVRFDYLSDKDYPFSSGVSVAFGLLIEHTPGKK